MGEIVCHLNLLVLLIMCINLQTGLSLRNTVYSLHLPVNDEVFSSSQDVCAVNVPPLLTVAYTPFSALINAEHYNQQPALKILSLIPVGNIVYDRLQIFQHFLELFLMDLYRESKIFPTVTQHLH